MRANAREVFASRTAKMIVCDGNAAQTVHCHRPIELIAAIDGSAALRCDDGNVLRSNFFLVPPMVLHALASYSGRLVRIYLDIGYRRLTAWKGRPILSDFENQTALRTAIERFFESGRSDQEAGALIDEWLSAWLDEQEIGPPCDGRVATVLAYLDSRDAPLRADRTSLARLVSLSPTRLASIFVADTGMSLSRYLIWRRVKIALTHICAGESITRAAVEAGFADGAHLTRSCRSTYGCTPSSVIGFSVTQITHRTFGEPAISDRHVCLAPHAIQSACQAPTRDGR